jgi:hypothetical protein
MKPASAHIHVTVAGVLCTGCKTVRGVQELVLRDNETGVVIGCADCAAERLLR